jgi:hypothetical protein
MTVGEYRTLAKTVARWQPDPFTPYTKGAWHTHSFPQVVAGVTSLLSRFDAGDVSEHQLLRGKDNDKRPGPNGLPRCHDTLSYWLYFQHHPGHELWKLLGQVYWSVGAYLCWHDYYHRMAPDRRSSRTGAHPSLKTFPKKGLGGLISEHVVPKKAMKALLLRTRNRDEIEALLRLNLCCVVTSAEDRGLETAAHPSPSDPWARYRSTGIVMLHNPAWLDTEIESLLRNSLLDERSMSPFPQRSL